VSFPAVATGPISSGPVDESYIGRPWRVLKHDCRLHGSAAIPTLQAFEEDAHAVSNYG
jgi:hypothetical protein